MVQSGEQRASQEVETKQRRSSWLIFSKLSMTRKRMHMLLLAQQHPANILCRFFLLKDRWLEYNLRVVSCLSIIPKLLSLIHIVALQRSKLSSRNLNAVRTIASPPGAGRVRLKATNRQVVCAVGSVPCQNRMSTCDALFGLYLGEDIFIIGLPEDVSLLHSPIKEVYCIPREEFQTKWDYAETGLRRLECLQQFGHFHPNVAPPDAWAPYCTIRFV